MFSVIIPTLQLSPYLDPLLALYDAHPLVGEIIVIDNAETPLTTDAAKARVIHPGRNLFVNPSWNLGVREARCDHVVISNDDLLFPPPLLDAVADRLGPKVGMIGPHTSCLSEANSRPPAFLPAHERTPGYGVLMFLAKADWVPIPDDLLVWSGDDFQFGRQTKRNYWFTRTRIETPMGLTSRRPEFSAVKASDLATYRARYAADAPYVARFGREAAVVNGVRSLVRRVRGRNPSDA